MLKSAKKYMFYGLLFLSNADICLLFMDARWDFVSFCFRDSARFFQNIIILQSKFRKSRVLVDYHQIHWIDFNEIRYTHRLILLNKYKLSQ